MLVLQRPRAPVQHRHRGRRESVSFRGGIDWLRECGVDVIDLHSEECIAMLGGWIAENPDVWNEDIGEG